MQYFFGNEPMAYGETGRVIGFSTDVAEIKADYNFSVFPNPTNGLFSVQVENFGNAVSGALYSVDGTQHKRYFFNTVEELETFEFNVSGLESGVYFIELTDSKSKGFKQIVLN